MDHFPLLFSELFIAKDNGNSVVRVFVSEPTPLEEKNLGRLFALIEIETPPDQTRPPREHEEIIDLIINTCNTAYYHSEFFEPHTALESTLQRLNKKLQPLVAALGAQLLQHTNVIIGIQSDRKIIFATLGKVMALLICQGNIIDIVDTTATKTQTIDPQKIFNNTLAGEIPTKGTIFFAVERILDYLSRQKIKHILHGQSPDKAVENLRNLLGEDTGNTNFVALILQTPEEETTMPQQATTGAIANQLQSIVDHTPAATADSMATLVDKEQLTNEFLNYSLWPAIKKSASQKMKNWLKGQNNDLAAGGTTTRNRTSEFEIASTVNVHNYATTTTRQPVSSQPKALIYFKKFLHVLAVLLTFILKGLSGGVNYLKKLLGGRRQNFSNYRHRERSSQSMTAIIGQGLVRALRWFGSLTRIQKIFFVVAVVVLLIFAQSVVNRGEDKIQRKDEQQYSELVANIDKKINEGKAAALYDSTKARALFLEARNLFNQLPHDSKSYKERGTIISEELAKQLAKVNNVINVENPTAVLDFSAINPQIKVSKMILLGASIYGFDQNNLSVYRGNLENQGTTVTISDNSGKKVQAVTKASPGTGVASVSDDNLTIFNPITEAFSPLDLGYGDKPKYLADLVVYGVRLYTLDTVNNQIYRHQRSGEEFAAAVAWLTAASDANLENAVSMAIDGQIYVLKNNGKLLRFISGTKDDQFNLPEIDPALTSADVVFTDENTSNIYIVDSLQKRVIIFTKDSKLVAQYTSPVFTDLKDIIVDEANHRFYLLNNSRVYQIDLQKSESN